MVQPAWELVPGVFDPMVTAPGTTTAVHFIGCLVANSALAGPEAGENMRKLCLRLLTAEGWESVDDIREGVTDGMLTTAAVYCEVGAGYYKQFLRHLGTPPPSPRSPPHPHILAPPPPAVIQRLPWRPSLTSAPLPTLSPSLPTSQPFRPSPLCPDRLAQVRQRGPIRPRSLGRKISASLTN